MSAAGTWALTIEGYEFVTVTLKLRVSGSEVTGRMTAFGQTRNIYDGKIGGDRVSWKVKIPNPPGEAVIARFAGTIDGNNMSGTVTTSQGTLNFTATREERSMAARIRRLLGLARSKDASAPSSPT